MVFFRWSGSVSIWVCMCCVCLQVPQPVGFRVVPGFNLELLSASDPVSIQFGFFFPSDLGNLCSLVWFHAKNLFAFRKSQPFNRFCLLVVTTGVFSVLGFARFQTSERVTFCGRE